jgi:hypothetical protein
MSELKGKPAAIDERRTVAERELGNLTHHQERIAGARGRSAYGTLLLSGS